MGSYPVVEVPFLSGGIVIAAIALVHVVLVADRDDDPERDRLAYLKRSYVDDLSH